MSFCVNLSDFYCTDCPDPELGRVSAVAFVKKGIPVTDPELDQTWVDLICNGYAVIIPNVRGTYNGGEIQEGPGYGRVPTRRQSTNHEISYMHPYHCDNVDFYNQLNFASDYEIWYTNGSKLWRSTEAVHASAKAAITDSTSDTMEFEVVAKWTYKYLSYCYEAPQIFDSCEQIERLLACLTCNPITIPCP